MNLVQQIESENLAARTRGTVDVRPGDTVRVHVRIVEGTKSRIQIFEGTCIRIKKGGIRTTFTVRKIASGVGVERIFPGMIPGPEAEAMAADALGGMVSVGLIPNTLMVDVRVRHPDPAVAADMANTLVSLYFERRNAVFAGRDADYYRSRLVSAQAAVDRLADETRRLLDGGDPLSFETERGILVARQATLQSQIAEDEALKTGLAVRLASLESELATLPDTVVEYRTLDRNPVVSAAQTSRVLNGTVKAVCLCIHCVQIWTTELQKV